MYSLSVGALFKNESAGMKEWLDHYIARGAQHFYLIDDNSTDNYMEVLRPYIDKGLVTLYIGKEPYYVGRQRNYYNRHILPHAHETEWLIMVDMDEYIWSSKLTNLYILLKIYFNDIAQIQIVHTLFGSNGHISQPKSIVAGFTKRTKEVPSVIFSTKYIINTKYKVKSLNIHHATLENEEDIRDKFKIYPSDWFRMNHYSCQSRDFWRNVKCTRGDADQFRSRGVDDAFWQEIDVNEVEDTELYEQNRRLGLC